LAAWGAANLLTDALNCDSSLPRRISTAIGSADASGDAVPAAAASISAPLLQVPVGRLQHAITPPVCEHLRRHGFAVIDGVFGGEAAAALRAEVEALRHMMHKNCTHLVRGGATSLLEKQGIWEAELRQPETQVMLGQGQVGAGPAFAIQGNAISPFCCSCVEC
jgi:hypothetical protein